MQRYILDTSVLISFSKNHEQTKYQLLKLIDNKEKIAICAISVAEFFAGISPEERVNWESFIGDLLYWNISFDAAIRAGQYRYDFARKGITLSTTDSLIAAIAWENNATIITNNVKDFPMKDVKLLSI